MNKKVRWEFKLLTASYAKAFVEKCNRLCLSPIHLKDVIEDML